MNKHISTVLLFICLLLFISCTETGGEIKYISPSPAPSEQALILIPIQSSMPSRSVTVERNQTTPAPTATPRPTYTPIPTPAPTSPIEGKIARMSVKEKIGQLVMFGFSGTESVSSEFKEIMRTYKIGNVILYGPNIDKERSDGGFSRCRKLTDSLRSYCAVDVPLLIAIDVEGGSVIRFKWSEDLISAASLGRNKSLTEAETQFEMIGEGLLSAGINLDLAPVMDVAKDPSKTFLDKRIISSSAQTASKIGSACIRGLHNSGCLSLVKHFPGHGATASDSHETTPIIRKTVDELSAYELIPFQAAIDAGADGVMVGHLSYPKIDPEHVASQSEFFITELLREQMGFNGFIMSDDFRMNGLRKQSPLKEAAVNFILAGGDIILCGPNHDYQRQIMNGLYQAYENGILTEARIDESVLRILTAKERID